MVLPYINMNPPWVYTCLFLFMYFGVSSLKKKKRYMIFCLLYMLPQAPAGGARFAEVVVQVCGTRGQAHLSLQRAARSLDGREGLLQGCGDHLCFCSAVFSGFVTTIRLFLENYYSQLGAADLLFVSRVLSGFF